MLVECFPPAVKLAPSRNLGCKCGVADGVLQGCLRSVERALKITSFGLCRRKAIQRLGFGILRCEAADARQMHRLGAIPVAELRRRSQLPRFLCESVRPTRVAS